MSSGNSNPILRRLGVEGVGTSGHFIGGRFGKTAEEVEDEALRLLARVFMDETSEGEIDLTSAYSKSGHTTAKGFKCRLEIFAVFDKCVAVGPAIGQFFAVAHADQVNGDAPPQILHMRHDIAPQIG